jgi:hypothetical protein
MKAKRKCVFFFWVDVLLHTNKKEKDLRTEQIQKHQFSNKDILLQGIQLASYLAI